MTFLLLLSIAPLPSRPEPVKLVACTPKSIVVRSVLGPPTTVRLSRETTWPTHWWDWDGECISVQTYMDMRPGSRVILGIRDLLGDIREYEVEFILPVGDESLPLKRL